MIANLNGVYETVEYRDDSSLQLYDNTDYEAYPRHWHTCIEIIMPSHNPYSIEYDGQKCTLQEGEILFICPGALHSLEACKGQRWIFQAEMSAVTQLSDVEAYLTILYPALVISPSRSPEIYDDVHRLFSEIVREYCQEDVFYEASIYSKLMEMMVLIRRNHAANANPLGASGSKQREYMDKFMDVCNFINEHCTEDLSLDMVADRAGFSKYHFSRLFKQFTNISFYKYLNQKRIENAEKLLIRPEMSVTEASLASGFTSLSSFIRMFKLIKGCTPSEYRAMYNL